MKERVSADGSQLCSAGGTADWDKKLLRTLLLVNLAGILEKADEALLPAVYREIGLSLHASPSSLGSLTVLRSIVQTLCFPLAAYLSARYNRASIIALGALLWAIATFFVGVSSAFLEVAVSRALNGIGLAMVIPAIQSLVADVANPDTRGLAFGWLQFTANLGKLFANVFAVLLAGMTVFGLAGWRVSFHIIAAASVVVACLVYQFAIDPRFKKEGLKEQMPSSALKETLIEAKTVMKIPTFIAIVAQGVTGSFPWAALSFTTMWLELIGFSHTVTAAISGSFIFSTSLGGLFGGWLGDIVARHLPNTGRVILAQFSSGIAIPFGAILLLFLPYDSSTAFLHGAVFVTMGFLISWCGPATNNPIFAEIVAEKMRTSIYALDRSFETLTACFAPLLVGLLAENVFGYVSPDSSDNADADTQNAVALGKALYVAFGIPYSFCCLLYFILYWTYPNDRDKAQVLRAEPNSNQEVSPGISRFDNLNPASYASPSEESEGGGPEIQQMRDTGKPRSSGEKEPLLSEMS